MRSAKKIEESSVGRGQYGQSGFYASSRPNHNGLEQLVKELRHDDGREIESYRQELEGIPAYYGPQGSASHKTHKDLQRREKHTLQSFLEQIDDD